MTQVTEAVELELSLTGTREGAAEFSAAAKTFESRTEGVEAAFKSLTSTSMALDSKLKVVEKDFESTSTDAQMLQGRMKSLTSSVELASGAFAAAAAKLGTYDTKAAEAEAAISSLRNEVASLKKQMEEATKPGSTFGDIFKGALAAGFVQAGVHAATSEVRDFIKESITANLQLEKMARTFTYAAGSAEGGAEEIAFARAESARLGLELQTTGAQYAKLTAASKGTTLEGQKTRDIFDATAEAVTALGLSTDESSGALNAIQQMMSKGTVQAEELRGQLGERIPGAFQAAAHAMGKSTMALGKMLEQGEVLSDDFLPKLAEEWHKTYGQAAVEAADGAQASFNKFNNALFESKAILGEQLMPTLVEFTEYVAQEAIPFWVDLFSGIKSGAEDTRLLREEIQHLADIKGPGAAYTPEMEIQAKKNLAERKAALQEAMALQKEENHRATISAKPASAAAPGQELSSERLNAIASLEKEISKARAQATMEGYEAERAIEKDEYARRLIKFKGQDKELELARQAHVANMALISKKEADTEAEAQGKAHAAHLEIEASNAKIRKQRSDRAVAEDEAATKAHYEGEAFVRNQNIELEKNEFEKRRMQSAAHFQEMREATLDHAAKDLKNYGRYQAQLTALEKKETAARVRIDRDEMLARTELGVSMASNLLQAIDGFYSQSKKNALLHKSINIGLIEMDGAVAAMRAFKELGPIAGGFSALFIEAKTQAAAFKVAQQKFAQGGVVEGAYTSGDRIQVGVNAGEMILTRAQQANLFAMANGQGGSRTVNHFELNYTGGDMSFPGNGMNGDIGRMIRNQPNEFARAVEELISKGYIKWSK